MTLLFFPFEIQLYSNHDSILGLGFKRLVLTGLVEVYSWVCKPA